MIINKPTMKKQNPNLEEAALLRIKAEEKLKRQKEKAEQEAEQEKEKYKELFDFAPFAYLSITKEGRILELNTAAARMLGKERSELTKKNLSLFISKETLADFNLFFQNVFTTKTKQTCEVILLSQSNPTLAQQILPIDVNIDGLLSKDGEVCLLTLTDITERKKAEIALKESEEKTRFILKHNPNAMAVFDNQMNLLIASDRFLDDYNVKDKNIIGKNHYEVFPELPEKWRNVHKRALQGEVLRDDDDYFIRPDGSITYTRWECRPWYHSDNSIGGMIAYTEVITERKLAEIALKESEKNLQLKNEEYESINEELLQANEELHKAFEKAEESEKQFRQLFENMEQGFAVHEMIYDNENKPIDYRFLHINNAFEKLTGINAKDVINKTVKEVLPKTEQLWIENYGKVAQTGISLHFENYSQELNKYYDVIAYSPKQNYFAVIFKDITKNKLYEQELLKAKEKAERNEIELTKAQKIAHLGTWYLDVETNEVVWTEELYKMYGFDPSIPPPPYTEHMKLFTPESWEILSKSLAKTRETGIPYELELKTIRKDDSNGWMWVRGEAVFDKNNNITGLWGAAQDITERKLVEEKLKTSDRIFKHSLDMLCIAGFDGYFKVLNPSWTKTLGWSSEELLSKPWIDFVHPNDKDNTKDIKSVIVDGKEVYQFENRYMCKDGSIKWLSWNSFPYPEENIMFGVARDVTVSKQRELILNNFFEQPLNLNLIADFNGKIKRANRAWEIFLGYKKDEIIGCDFFDLIHPDDISITIEEMKKLEKGISTLHFENRYRHKYGEYRKLAWSAITSLDEHLVYAVAIDITEKHQAEEALRKSEAIKNAMVSNIGDVIVIFDRKGINKYQSPNVTKLFGWKPEELIGKSIWDTIHPDDLIAAQKFIGAIAIEPNATRTTEMRYKRRDGEYVWIEISVKNLMHDKNIQGILGNYRNITDRRQAEQIRHQLDVSQKSALFKQNFLANMSHEIRTPLTGILGMIDILRQTHLSEEQHDYINTLKISGENLREIINQVLDYSKIEAGKVSLNPTAFQFRSLTRDTLNLYKNSLKNGVKLFDYQNPQIPATIIADRFRLSQVINNLMTNALKFTQQGSVTIRSTLVSMNAHNKEMVIKIEVVDTGIGIAVSLQKKLFVPFSQIDAADIREYEGTGLGLSICKQLIEMMGGEIGVVSQEGKGSTFWFTFPATIADETHIPDLKKAIPVPVRKLNILLAEDKAINQKVIKLMLSSLGHDLQIACNGKIAVDQFVPRKFDLILMDIQMPVMDGVTATQKLKEKYDDLPPIVGLSANAFEGDREKYMALGMDEYLTKPVKKEDFEELIKKLF
jgi:PAS domain S-box-containing protein